MLIAGPSGSGKSTVARALHGIDPVGTAVVHFDDFQHDAIDLTRDNEGYVNWDTPDFTNFNEAYEKLLALKMGRTVYLQAKNEYDNPSYIKGEYKRIKIEVKPAPLIIAEGHYALLNDRVRSLAELSIFLHTDFSVSAARRTKKSDSRYDEKYLRPMHEAYVYPTQHCADTVINVAESSKDVVFALVCRRIQSLRSINGN